MFSRSTGKDGSKLSSYSSETSCASMTPSTKTECEILKSANVKVFSYNDLRLATRNFGHDSVLGEGGFGPVYKGWIDEHTLSACKPGTGIPVAVRMLNQEGSRGYQELLAEVNYLGQFFHPNIVKLIGYCLEDKYWLLVYEYMPCGSLDNHLLGRHSHFQPLSWNLRLKAALGAAKGLAHLHSAEANVIHRNIKTSNILLDTNYTAKLSDFGFAKDGPVGGKSHVSTRVIGTYGYAAPEYVATGHLTAKCDIYSFGVVLLEMLTGRRAIDKNRPQGEQNLVEWARPFLTHKRKIFHVLDTRLEGQYSPSGAQTIAALVVECLNFEAKTRPSMDVVVSILEGIQDSSEATRKPAERHQDPKGAGKKMTSASVDRNMTNLAEKSRMTFRRGTVIRSLWVLACSCPLGVSGDHGSTESARGNATFRA